jgi:hypothetical protein
MKEPFEGRGARQPGSKGFRTLDIGSTRSPHSKKRRVGCCMNHMRQPCQNFAIDRQIVKTAAYDVQPAKHITAGSKTPQRSESTSLGVLLITSPHKRNQPLDATVLQERRTSGAADEPRHPSQQHRRHVENVASASSNGEPLWHSDVG